MCTQTTNPMNFTAKIASTFIIALFVSSFAKAQLTGTLTDTNKEPIPFASIYIKGTYNGTGRFKV
jgi:hypothetical protein